MKSKRTWLEKYNGWLWLEYGVFSLLVLGPMLMAGYILTLDLVFTPYIAWPSDISNIYPLQVALWLLHQVVPSEMIEKGILWGIIVLSGVGMHLLVKKHFGEYPNSSVVAPYFAGLFYAVNPFTYSRFMAGQWMVLLGYALLPFFVAALLKWLATPSIKRAVITGLWIFGIVSVSIHQTLILPVVLLAAITIRIVRAQRIDNSFFWQVLILVAVPLLLSSFWLVPALAGAGVTAESIAQFDATHFQAFATTGGGIIGSVAEVLRLQGFWADVQQLYILPQQKIPLWGLLWVGVWALVVIGYAALWRVNKRQAVFVAVLFVAGLLVATTSLAEWVSRVMPAAQGLREPHKFAMLVAFSFAIGGAFGVAALQQRIKKRFSENISQSAAMIFILLIFLITPTMFWGFSGQLVPRQYPDGWVTMNGYLKERLIHKKILFLPWHQYANYSFSERIIANPAEKFFEVPVMVSDEPEFRDISPTEVDPEKKAVSAALKHKDMVTLRSAGVQYVLLAEEQEYMQYDWMIELATIEKRTDGLLLLNIGGKNG